MKKIQLLSAYSGPGMTMTEKDPYFVHGSYSLPMPSDGLNVGNGQEAVLADIVVAVKKNTGYQVAEATV